ncbi:MAG: enoyl-CoA hydratase/isomerase family protein [Dehalococcoidaceae bacterium]|nr:enoyl-CoA hydratase/isomerase family protein [Dehalococcoidaceae bacterium]
MSLNFEINGKVAVFTLNRPEALNAIDMDLLKELSKALCEFKKDENLHVGIITGAGQRAFSVGADVNTLLPEMKKVDGNSCSQPPTNMRGLSLYKPLIAAINGAALGGGLELALACDLRIASQRAFLGLPEVNLGIIPGWGGTQRLMRLIPQAKAAEMLFTGRPIDAAEAHRIGLVNKVVPPEKLMDEAMEMAGLVLKPAQLAVRAAKQAMLQGASLSLDSGLRLEKSLFEMLMSSNDFNEGLTALKEKRKPNFEGR